jgi:hypothetical protein
VLQRANPRQFFRGNFLAACKTRARAAIKGNGKTAACVTLNFVENVLKQQAFAMALQINQIAIHAQCPFHSEFGLVVCGLLGAMCKWCASE